MNPVDLLVVLLALAAAAIWLSLRVGVPYPVALVATGALLGIVPGVPQVPFPSDLVLAMVLPPVLWSTALRISWRDFRQRLPSISMLAVGLVIATTLAVGATLKWLVPEMPWAVAFVLGAIISPSDAAAPQAVFARMSAPPSLIVTLQGESLLNDASGLVLYRLAVAAVLTGSFSLGEATLQFFWVAAGGALIGAAGAWVSTRISRGMGDPSLQTLFGIVVPFGLYALAETAHVSGVLAVVVGGLMASRAASRDLTPEARILGRSTWEVITLGLDALIFTLIGSQMGSIVMTIDSAVLPRLLVASVVLALVTVVVRMAVVFPGTWLGQWRTARVEATRPAKPQSVVGLDPAQPLTTHALPETPNVRAADDPAMPPPWKLALVMGWCGMRGIVSLTAALALPMTLPDGSAFPLRNEVVFLTFVLVVLTLLVPGITLAPLMRALGLQHDEGAGEELLMARRSTADAALERLKVLHEDGRIDGKMAAHLRRETRAQMRVALPEAGEEPARDPFVQARTEMTAAQRERLLQLSRSRRISEQVLHEVESEIDHAEALLRRVVPETGANSGPPTDEVGGAASKSATSDKRK